MYRFHRTAALLAAAVMALLSPFPSLAAGPGEGLSSSNAPIIAGSGSSSGTTDASGSAGQDASEAADPLAAIRPAMALSHNGDFGEDPVLGLVPLATYHLYDGDGQRVDYGYTHEADSFAYAGGGFNRILLEHQNVGRWYYRTYSANTGWGPWAISGETTPDRGQVQAVMFRVKGYTHKFGELYYRAVLNDGTTTDWARAGQACGVIGGERYIVALKLALWNRTVPFEGAVEKPLANENNEGIVKADGGVGYSTADGHAYTGWAFDEDSNQYYFENGFASTGWKAIEGYNYYFYENGILAKDLEPVMGLQSSYAIRINKATRSFYVLTKDAAGQYTIPYKTFLCTVGPDTPIGSFKIYQQYRWHFMHTDCYTQFLSRFNGHFLIHSLLYTKPDLYSFTAANYNYMDQAQSGGCVRLKASDSAWVYNNCKGGTPVTVYADRWDKGPVEKDAIEQAIPLAQNYDPTDPVILSQQSAADAAAAAAAQEAAEQEAANGEVEPNA